MGMASDDLLRPYRSISQQLARNLTLKFDHKWGNLGSQ
jgi:hypothetical protein